MLDVGCGPGTLDKYLIDLGHEVYGLEISSEAAHLAKEMGVNVIIYDVEEQFPFKPNTFDMVLALDILEHLFQPAKTLEFIRRVLRDDGELIISFPNHFDLRNRLRILVGKGIVHWDHQYVDTWEYFHIHFFTLREIRNFLAKHALFSHKLQLNYLGYKFFDKIPRTMKLYLLKKYPDIFAGRFIVSAKKIKPLREELILIPYI